MLQRPFAADIRTAPVLSASVGNCNGTIGYQWLLNGSPISGATSATYSVPTGLASGSYGYRLQVLCGTCCTFQHDHLLTVLSAPQVTINTSGSASLLRWHISAAPTLTSATSGCSPERQRAGDTSSYRSSHHRGNQRDVPESPAWIECTGSHVYTLVATCGSCSGTSNSISVTVSMSPSVTAIGQWWWYIGDGLPPVHRPFLSSAQQCRIVRGCHRTNGMSMLFLSVVQRLQAMRVPSSLGVGTWTYTAVVTCGACSTSSNTVAITVNPSPSVQIAVNGSTSLCTGYLQGPVLTALVGSCSGTPSYQWYRDGQVLTGATAPAFTVPTGLAAGTYNYAVVVTCGGCTATGSVAVDTVSPSATVSISTTQPVQLCTGYSTGPTLQSSVMCYGTPSYQWMLNGTPISGATGADLHRTDWTSRRHVHTITLVIICGTCMLHCRIRLSSLLSLNRQV